MLQEKKLLQFILKEMQRSPEWKIIVLRNCWLCPYCGEIGVEELSMEDAIEERIALHFLGGSCSGWNYGEGSPLALETLRKRALLITFRHRIQKTIRRERIWHFTDLDGCWVCPYCARSTGILLRDIDSPDPETQDRVWTRISVHLLECPESKKGEGDLLEKETLIRRIKNLNQKKRIKRLRRRVKDNPVYALKDMERNWFCPFCAEATEVPFSKSFDDEMIEGMRQHFDRCVSHANREGRPHSLSTLKRHLTDLNEELVLKKVRRKVSRHEAWQHVDLEGRWYCPYCATATNVRPTDFEEVSETVLQGVWDHLSRCTAYVSKNSQVKPPEYMRSVIDGANREIELKRTLKRNLSHDPRWSVRDETGCWFCPYCCKVHKHIHLEDSGGRVLAKTLEQISDHLEMACTDFEPGQPPNASLEELRALARGEPNARRPAPIAKRSHIAMPEDAFVRSLTREVAELRDQVAVSEELKRELHEASIKQRRLLPQLPRIPGLEFGCLFKPCRQVGGDFYTFFQVSEDELGLAIGDISGHGIDVAILMGLAKKLLEVHGRERSSPAQTLIMANADIYPDLDAKTFVTVFYGILDPRSRKLRFSRAGHNPLILYSPFRDPRLQVLDSKGMALGMDMGSLFAPNLEEVEIQLKPGDLVLQYTDGVCEAMNQDDEEFGLERLFEVVEEYGEHEAEYLLFKIDKALYEFTEGARQRDDITMLAFKVMA